MQDRCKNCSQFLLLATVFSMLFRHICTRALRDLVRLPCNPQRFILQFSTRPLPDEPILPQNETSDTRYCDRQCHDDFSIHMKPNTNEEEIGRTRFRLIETSARLSWPSPRRSRPSRTAVRVGECRFEDQ